MEEQGEEEEQKKERKRGEGRGEETRRESGNELYKFYLQALHRDGPRSQHIAEFVDKEGCGETA